ncbi:(2Fe-2S)-binding protein [Vibrio profundum]|uniref:(2Fe-2S)-binding protein n=1 Tax=Vibrio profundum TaxID=2910247 RepID=UPI003D115AE5
MFVCLCHGISDKEIKKLVIEQGITDIRTLKKCTALGSQCGKCVKYTKEILTEATLLEVKQII